MRRTHLLSTRASVTALASRANGSVALLAAMDAAVGAAAAVAAPFSPKGAGSTTAYGGKHGKGHGGGSSSPLPKGIVTSDLAFLATQGGAVHMLS